MAEAYGDTNVFNYKWFHWRKVNRWNMLFADGHVVPVEVRRGVWGEAPTSGPGWRFECRRTE